MCVQLPTVTPTAKCKLRLLKLERIKDYLLMEEEFVANQERLKPADQRAEEERSKARALRRDSPRHAARIVWLAFISRKYALHIPPGRLVRADSEAMLSTSSLQMVPSRRRLTISAALL